MFCHYLLIEKMAHAIDLFYYLKIGCRKSISTEGQKRHNQLFDIFVTTLFFRCHHFIISLPLFFVTTLYSHRRLNDNKRVKSRQKSKESGDNKIKRRQTNQSGEAKIKRRERKIKRREKNKAARNKSDNNKIKQYVSLHWFYLGCLGPQKNILM